MAVFLVAVWIWRGRGLQARSWVRIPVIGNLGSLMALPSVGAICVGLALVELDAPDWVSMPIALAGCVPVLWGFPILTISVFFTGLYKGSEPQPGLPAVATKQ